MHNLEDYFVPYIQASQWYGALTRLGKRAWMLNYDNEGHTIRNFKNQLDYSIRLEQFFDHYLKDKPAPKWMTEGGASLELDTSRKEP
ncbi:MAG: prolyl oligopeptidase family serine peptidase [Puia sp.]